MVQLRPASLFVLQNQVEVYMNASGNEVYRAISYDNGSTWNPFYKLRIKTNDALACAASGNARTRYYVYRRSDTKFSLVKRNEFGYDDGSSQILGSGVFTSAPSMTCSPDGNTIFVFGRGNDNRFWWALSRDGGNNWQLLWGPLGAGTFKSAPSAVMSADGNTLCIFGLGMDNRVWYAQSSNGGNNWNVFYGPISNAVFTSAPAACISADGKKVMVVCRGNDKKFYYNDSTDKGISWGTFRVIGEGVFLSGPSVCCSWDRMYVHVFGVGNDKKIWRAIRDYPGSTQWQGWWQVNPGMSFITD